MGETVKSETCGAKLRDGSLCTVQLPDGKGRCFKHGGAPRSGAPKGNSNALKHGRYADGYSGRRKARNTRNAEADMTYFAQRELFTPPAVTVVSPAEQRGGLVLIESLRRLATALKMEICRKSHSGRTEYSRVLARRDVLRLLLSEPSWFDFESAYRRRVCVIFLARFKVRAKLRAGINVDPVLYSRAWANYSDELFWESWPNADQEGMSASDEGSARWARREACHSLLANNLVAQFSATEKQCLGARHARRKC